MGLAPVHSSVPYKRTTRPTSRKEEGQRESDAPLPFPHPPPRFIKMVAATRRSLLLVCTMALGALAGVATVGAAVAAGQECPCVLYNATGGQCLREASGGTCVPVACERSYVCVAEAMASHMCLARKVDSELYCKGAISDSRCQCTSRGPTKPHVVMVPMQRKEGRTGGVRCMAGKESHMRVSVEGKPFSCVAPMDIGSRTVAGAYSYKNGAQQKWRTKDDSINLVFLKSTQGYSAGNYLCVVMGSKMKGPSALKSKTRMAQSRIMLQTPTRYAFTDDPTRLDERDVYRQSSSRKTLVVSQKWQDAYTDGFCFAVKSTLRADFFYLRYLSGLAVWRGGSPYPTLGPQAFWSITQSDKLRNKSYSNKWAYTSGRLAYPYTPARPASYARKAEAKPPPPSIQGVVVTPVCGC